MDLETLHGYDREATAFAVQWHDQPVPDDLRSALLRWFRPGPTADIGCGSGRDAAWLSANGFPAIGYDPSEGLLVEARKRYPEVSFRRAALPGLEGVPAGSFANVLCETVLMHLEPEVVPAAVRRLRELLQPGGTLYLSWRVVPGGAQRDQHGRLYAPVDLRAVHHALEGCESLLDEESTSASSGKAVHRMVVRS
ncbi:class I SAM-dependent methyltransferase [Kitasatospora sp. RB6PN24]|uniref:class I SAM-dependent methyltransferase n=1 Tax=Kitasatospora humi TaxID=2893891 RepID=UPI001E44E7BC|nr:class I SAM-dependent methyltransferase [Kitasatospora humi]MCC9305652.1 class I SAM-dependent methyltransferase [Kitasatospora humi]